LKACQIRGARVEIATRAFDVRKRVFPSGAGSSSRERCADRTSANVRNIWLLHTTILMTLGAPLLVAGNQPTVLSRVGTEQKYQECLLQELIDQQPSILPVSDFCASANGIFSLGREIPVEIGDTEGLIDNALVTDDGHLVVVETKLWRNPQAIREVVAQTLQYGMAVSQLSALEFEGCLRRGDPRGRMLGTDETVAQYVQNVAASESMPGLDDDFEDVFDRLRRAGEIILLIVADCVRSSVERIVHWMNSTIGSAPFRLGLVELCLYDLPDSGRIVVPQTLLRIREGTRHVVTINVQSTLSDQVKVSVRGPDGSQMRAPAPSGTPLTEDALTGLIRAKNSPEIVDIAEELRTLLRSSGLATKPCPSEILYGVDVEGDFISLVHVCARYVYFLIPKRAVQALGDERFVDCKRKVNQIANFYRPFDVDDPSKTGNLLPKYGVLKHKVRAFVAAVTEIAEIIQGALKEVS
jgi:hypothetical protein